MIQTIYTQTSQNLYTLQKFMQQSTIFLIFPSATIADILLILFIPKLKISGLKFKKNKDMKSDIFNKNGFLSFYGLSCGYVQNHITMDYEVQLYRENAIYNVRNIQTSEETNRSIIFWQCYETLNEAKKQYNLIKKNIQINGRNTMQKM